jgi:hypothetical protein
MNAGHGLRDWSEGGFSSASFFEICCEQKCNEYCAFTKYFSLKLLQNNSLREKNKFMGLAAFNG